MSESADLAALHRRYAVQAAWTAENRQRLYDLADVTDAARVLEVGSGTGVITADLGRRTSARVVGVDLDLPAARYARREPLGATYCNADGVQLPFCDHAFQVTLCHYLLLWVKRPRSVLSEMVRVTAGSGMVLALAEPDYGGRMDYPDHLAEYGELQARALAERGADPRIGRKLRELFHQAGLLEVQVGLLGGMWTDRPDLEGIRSERETLRQDVAACLSPRHLREFEEADQRAWLDGSRILFVPTFFASGRVPAAA